jgi:NAD(P)H-hydrate epimerase
MKAVSAEQMRGIDRQMIEAFGVSGDVLMDRAGFGVAERVRRLADTAGFDEPRVAIFAGRGNNGGDAFVAARYLHEIEMDVEVLFAGDIKAVGGDALLALRKLRAAGVPLRVLETMDEWDDLRQSRLWGADILVDGLLGTGSRGPARGPVAGAIEMINRFSDHGLVVAIDMPSGLNADTGMAEGDAVVADVTVTIGLPKTCLLQPAALDYVGTVDVVDIGIEEELEDAVPAGIELITACDVAGSMARRPRRSHKGTYGHALLIGGGPGFSGAISLAAMAACRSGAGLVSVLVPSSLVNVVAVRVPEAMVHGGGMTDSGSLASDALDGMLAADGLARFSAVLIGPGLTTHPEGARLVEAVLASGAKTVVLDADALNLVAAVPDLLTGERDGVILTPHPGEMGRLMGCSAAAVEQDRFQAARRVSERFGAITVLKGAGTVVTDGTRLAVNLTGNPGMATGGVGDVLAGLLTGLAAQGMEPFDAASAAVFLHGCAGDDAARGSSQAGLTALALADEIPRVFRRVQVR